MPLEEEGAAGTKDQHFDKLAFGDELMVFNNVVRSKFSKMSLAVAQDSGFYEVDQAQGDLFTWGKGSGCALLQGKCNPLLSAEICTEKDVVSCDASHRHVRICSFESFTGSCGVLETVLDCGLPRAEDSPLFVSGQSSVCLSGKVP